MQNCYRNKIDIITSILNTVNGNEVKQLEILNKAKVTHRLFKEYLCIILQFGLIEYIWRQGTYKTTEKGIHFIGIYDKMMNLIH